MNQLRQMMPTPFWLSTAAAPMLALIATVVSLSLDVTPPEPVLRNPAVVADEPLLWRPPVWTETVYLEEQGAQQRLVLDNDVDYRIVLPRTPITGRVDVVGGRNIVIIGGAFRPFFDSDPEVNKVSLAFWNPALLGDEPTHERIIHIEGVLFDQSESWYADAIAVADERATFVIQNVRFTGVDGTFEDAHGDAIQNWAGAKEIRVHRASIRTNYQGFMLPPMSGEQQRPIEFLHLDQVDFAENPGADEQNCSLYLWVTQGESSCTSFSRGARFDEVYLAPSCSDFGVRDTYPRAADPESCSVQVSGDRLIFDLPGFSGELREGGAEQPVFVPPGVAGIGYASPGYVSE